MARHGIAFPFRAVIGLAALSLLNGVAFGQPFSGPGVFSGNTQFGALGGSGAPLTYSARTDGCVNPTATPSNCVGGTTTGQAGATLLFQEGVSDPIPTGFAATTISSGSCPSGLTPSTYPAYCPAPMNATATDPDFNSYLVMASDDNTNNSATPWGASWTVGSEGEHDQFSPDESLVLLNGTGGNVSLANVNPASIHSQTCATFPCVNKTGIYSASSGNGDSTHFGHSANVAAGNNPADPHAFYEEEDLLVNKVVVNSSIASPGAGTLTRTAYVDFSKDVATGGPVDCGVLPPITVGANTSNYSVNWVGSFNIARDSSIGFGMAGGYDWLPSWTPADAIGNAIFIYPLTNNTGHKGFQATTISSATGVSEPNWDSACTTTCIDGGVTWTNIGGLNVQGPGFDIISYRPGLGCSRVNTRLGKIYRGTGNSAPGGLFTTLDPVACTRATGAPCASTPANLPDRFTLHEVEEPLNGTFLVFGSTGGEGLNPPGNWNSGTLTCQPSGSSDVWAGAWSSGTTYTSKQTVSSGGFYYIATTATGNLNQIPPNSTYWTLQEAYCPSYIWNVATTLVQPMTAWGSGSGHTASCYLNRYYNAHYAAGSYANPIAQLSPPNGAITLNSGTQLLPTLLPCDNHGTCRNAGPLDLQPVFTVTTDVPAWTTRYTAPCYDEICAFANVATGTTAKEYRFAHTFNTGSSSFFSIQNNIGVISLLGDLVIFGTDMYGIRGDKTLGSTQCQNIRGALKPASGMALNVNDTVFPTSSNAGSYIFQATVGGLTSGAAPTGGWCQTLNCTATWGAATVKNIGANTCRGDVVIVDLLSAHPASVSGPLWTGIIDPARAVDWSGAGVVGGIPSNSWTQCGSTISVGASAATINAALAACPANHYVLLGVGTFNLSDYIHWSVDNVVLRGSGPTQTHLVFSNGAAGACGEGNASSICGVGTSQNDSSNPVNIANWTAGYSRGATSITIGANTLGSTKPAIGMTLVLDQLNDGTTRAADTGNVFNCSTSPACTQANGGNGRSGRNQQQTVTVTSISSGSCPCTVGVSPGLYMPNWRSGQTPQAWWANGPYQTGWGLENLSIDTSLTVNNGTGPLGAIELFNVNNSWIKNVNSDRELSSGSQVPNTQRHVRLYQSHNITIRDSYFKGRAGYDDYGVDFWESSDNLIENNIVQGIGTPFVHENGNGNVFGYNFTINNDWGNHAFCTPTTGPCWAQGSVYGHGTHEDFVLSEGNIGHGLEFENYFGQGFFVTSFRNRWTGVERSQTSQTVPAFVYGLNRYFNIVGNVLGTSGYHTTYQTLGGGSPVNCVTSVYAIGLGGNCNNGDGVTGPLDDTAVTNTAAATLMRWGNYDTANAAVRFASAEVPSGISPYPNPVPANNNLPPSFYISAKPSWFGSVPWPLIGPDVTGGNIANVGGYAYKNPAQLCYEGLGGLADGTGPWLPSFDASTCYP